MIFLFSWLHRQLKKQKLIKSKDGTSMLVQNVQELYNLCMRRAYCLNLKIDIIV
jgi:hypothetical protein